MFFRIRIFILHISTFILENSTFLPFGLQVPINKILLPIHYKSSMISIFLFELRYRLKRPATWIYAILFFALAMLLINTDGVRIGGGYGKVNSNSPYNIHQILSILSSFSLFIIMAFFAVPVFRDNEHKMDTFLYAYPISKKDYLAGRFLGTLFMCGLVYLFLPLGLMLGEVVARILTKEPGDWGPFNAMSYLWPFLIMILPNIFLLGSLFFTLVSLTRKMMYAYILALSFIVLYSITLDLLSDLDNKFLASLLDPFGLTASDRVTEYWSIAEKNFRLVPLTGVLVWNRILWMGIGAAVLSWTFVRFKMTSVADAAKGLGKKVKADESVSEKLRIPSGSWVPQFPLFNTFVSLWILESKQTLRNIIFLTLLIAIGVFMAVSAWFSDQSFDTGIYPVTGNMLESVTSNMFSILSIALLIFLAGEIVWRERQAKMEGIYDAFPTPNSVIFWSKFASLLLVPVFLLCLVPIVGISVQILKGYYNFEPGLYLKTILLFELPRLWLVAALAFCIQNVVNNKYTGNIAILAYYLSFIGLKYIKIEHPLFMFGSGMTYVYSDMNGFGDAVHAYRTYLLHWTFVSLFLLSIAYLFMVRGVEGDLRTRFKIVVQRIKSSRLTKLGVGIPFFAMMITGYNITYQSVVLDHFTNSKDDEKVSLEYEKKFSYLQRSNHAALSSVNIGADMFPENGDLDLRGDFVYYNPHSTTIDTLWYNYNSDGKISQFDISVPTVLIYQDSLKGIRAYKLKTPLAPGDSFKLNFGMHFGFTGLQNESPVKGNGTFFNNNYWPSVGFNGNYQIQDEDKRKENGLQELETMASQTDSSAIDHSMFDENNHSIRFEATLSTSPDQIAVAPGYLTREWTEKGRHYFHYKMDRPITNFYSVLSARYQVYKEKWNGIDIAVYHHPWHTFNVKKMAEAVRHSLEYYSKNFGPYQHKQVRILEFPRYSSFAQSFDNTIPYSEGIGFIANLEEEDAIDYVYFVTAHEMAHQWWGHQINPANARGAQFLSETMAEYSALMVMKKRYGDELMGRFLRRELSGYLNGRSQEKKKENPLMDIEMQSYAFYNKGSMAMYNVMDLIGEEKMNGFLSAFVKKYSFAHRPYPTTLDYYTALLPYLNPSQKILADDQLKRITLYKNKISSAKGKKLPGGQFEITLKVETGKMYVDSLGGNEKNVPFTGEIYFGLLNVDRPKKKGDVLLLEKRLVPAGKEIVFTIKKQPKYASLDPLNTLTDILPEDNTRLIDWD